MSEAEHLLGMNDPAQVQRTVPKATEREKKWGAAWGASLGGRIWLQSYLFPKSRASKLLLSSKGIM